MITTQICVRRKVWTTYSYQNPAGSGYCDEHHDRQYLVKEWRLGKILLWHKVLDTEDVPLYVSIQQATVGYSDWQSKFAQQIKDQQ